VVAQVVSVHLEHVKVIFLLIQILDVRVLDVAFALQYVMKKPYVQVVSLNPHNHHLMQVNVLNHKNFHVIIMVVIKQVRVVLAKAQARLHVLK
jgi:hypothetical protein